MSVAPLTDEASGTFELGDVRVRRLGFGAMRITGRGVWGEPPDRDAAKRVLRRAVELGIDLIGRTLRYVAKPHTLHHRQAVRR